jgi:hypothetical protein
MESCTDPVLPCKMLPLKHTIVQPSSHHLAPQPFLINSFAHPSEPVLILIVILLSYLLLVSSFIPTFIQGKTTLIQFIFQGLPMNVIAAMSILLYLAIWTFCNIETDVSILIPLPAHKCIPNQLLTYVCFNPPLASHTPLLSLFYYLRI